MDDSDPVVLAEHCERGNDLARAGSLYLRAAEQAHRRGDADTAVARARRGLQCGPDELARLGLLVVLCQVHLWRNSWAQAAEFAEEVMRLSTPGSPSWVIAATAKLVNARNADRHQFLSALEAIRQVEPEIDAMSTMAFALAIGIYLLDSAGEFALASSCLGRLHEIVDPVAEFNTVARAWMNRAHAHHESWVNEDPWAGLCYSEATQSSFLEANHTRGALDAQVFIAMNAWYLGAGERAERELRATLAMGEDLGLLSSLRTMLLIQVLGERGELAEAERAAVSLFESTQTTSLLRGRGLWALGEVRYQRRSHHEAAMLLREALEALGEAPLDRIAAQTTLVRALHEGGRSAEAVMCAEEALREGERLGSFGFRGARLHLAYAEALDALGNRPQARQVIEQALGRLAEQYDKISDLSFRQSFLRGVPEHRRLIELAADWDGRAPA
jgi:tetratricopeptide (TPR) repeat protein